MTIVTLIAPSMFEVIGTMENYHPRNTLRIQARFRNLLSPRHYLHSCLNFVYCALACKNTNVVSRKFVFIDDRPSQLRHRGRCKIPITDELFNPRWTFVHKNSRPTPTETLEFELVLQPVCRGTLYIHSQCALFSEKSDVGCRDTVLYLPWSKFGSWLKAIQFINWGVLYGSYIYPGISRARLPVYI